MASMNYKIDPADYLGFNHDVFKGKAWSLAVSEPKRYYELRSKIMQVVKTEALVGVYETFYAVLKDGTNKDGTTNLFDTYIDVAPAYPAQKASDLALDAVETMMPLIEEVMEILLPMKATETARKRTGELALAEG